MIGLRDDFAMSAGSVPGTDHTKPGQPGWRNNQDAFALHHKDDQLIAIVCDGCGSSPYSEVGALVGAQLAVKLLRRASKLGASQVDPKPMLDYLKETLVSQLKLFADNTFSVNAVEQAIEDYLLFTVIGILMNRDYTFVFSMGDGVWALNGVTTVIPPFPGNAPPYIGNHARKGQPDRPIADFVVHSKMETSRVGSVLIGSDGVKDFINVSENLLPGKEETVGPLSQFWTERRYVANPDNIRRRLALSNLETIEQGSGAPRIKIGLLPDDTTIVVVQKNSKEK